MNRIEALTRAYGITDADAAKLLGVRKSNLCTWRSGKRVIPDYIDRCIDVLLDSSEAHKKRIKERYL